MSRLNYSNTSVSDDSDQEGSSTVNFMSESASVDAGEITENNLSHKLAFSKGEQSIKLVNSEQAEESNQSQEPFLYSADEITPPGSPEKINAQGQIINSPEEWSVSEISENDGYGELFIHPDKLKVPKASFLVHQNQGGNAVQLNLSATESDNPEETSLMEISGYDSSKSRVNNSAEESSLPLAFSSHTEPNDAKKLNYSGSSSTQSRLDPEILGANGNLNYSFDQQNSGSHSLLEFDVTYQEQESSSDHLFMDQSEPKALLNVSINADELFTQAIETLQTSFRDLFSAQLCEHIFAFLDDKDKVTNALQNKSINLDQIQHVVADLENLTISLYQEHNPLNERAKKDALIGLIKLISFFDPETVKPYRKLTDHVLFESITSSSDDQIILLDRIHRIQMCERQTTEAIESISKRAQRLSHDNKDNADLNELAETWKEKLKQETRTAYLKHYQDPLDQSTSPESILKTVQESIARFFDVRQSANRLKPLTLDHINAVTTQGLVNHRSDHPFISKIEEILSQWLISLTEEAETYYESCLEHPGEQELKPNDFHRSIVNKVEELKKNIEEAKDTYEKASKSTAEFRQKTKELGSLPSYQAYQENIGQAAEAYAKQLLKEIKYAFEENIGFTPNSQHILEKLEKKLEKFDKSVRSIQASEQQLVRKYQEKIDEITKRIPQDYQFIKILIETDWQIISQQIQLAHNKCMENPRDSSESLKRIKTNLNKFFRFHETLLKLVIDAHTQLKTELNSRIEPETLAAFAPTQDRENVLFQLFQSRAHQLEEALQLKVDQHYQQYYRHPNPNISLTNSNYPIGTHKKPDFDTFRNQIIATWEEGLQVFATIKSQYQRTTSLLDTFQNNVNSLLTDPNNASALIQGAVEQINQMSQSLVEETIEEIIKTFKKAYEDESPLIKSEADKLHQSIEEAVHEKEEEIYQMISKQRQQLLNFNTNRQKTEFLKHQVSTLKQEIDSKFHQAIDDNLLSFTNGLNLISISGQELEVRIQTYLEEVVEIKDGYFRSKENLKTIDKTVRSIWHSCPDQALKAELESSVAHKEREFNKQIDQFYQGCFRNHAHFSDNMAITSIPRTQAIDGQYVTRPKNSKDTDNDWYEESTILEDYDQEILNQIAVLQENVQNYYKAKMAKLETQKRKTVTQKHSTPVVRQPISNTTQRKSITPFQFSTQTEVNEEDSYRDIDSRTSLLEDFNTFRRHPVSLQETVLQKVVKKYDTRANKKYYAEKTGYIMNGKPVTTSFRKKLARRNKSRNDMVNFVSRIAQSNAHNKETLLFGALLVVKKAIEDQKPKYTSTLWCIAKELMDQQKIAPDQAKKELYQFWKQQGNHHPQFKKWNADEAVEEICTSQFRLDVLI